ncbi:MULTISPECIES: phosphate regulon transcriptional regulator PhoB [Rhodobacterales]|uniref:phosphate regulon transcriptional regulator PhoB n=1 Tax=Roseobacter sp. N2S TaxID=2663844 RepID=UPI00285BB568|nr:MULTISPECIES: phosphate regulon transcriptional regulator PhoB [Rhodobacterales]MDR6266009.1 two-component system phosphate regulon response regulator PhoB [Roseobacter sp. N2S]
MSGGPKILVVEDEASQLEMLVYNLSVEGYEVFQAETGEEGLLILEEQAIDLLVLDWMLPQTSGLEICRQVKRNKDTKHIPVIMLTARGEEDDKIRGLDTGADDYVVKPYSVRELMARVRAGLRQATGQLGADLLVYQGLSMDLVQHKVSLAEAVIPLGPLEFKLLRVFMEAPGRVWSRDQLLDRVWGDNLNVDTRTVDVHIGRLRKQLSKVSDLDFVRTVRGFGYSLDTTA